ncbi:hypothetical protein SDRG_00600 [Saprolegnia diclina VS20]|uniref:WRKY19-like zinc finger domain-containing protein n=1 Tax=Saprolegnia diclina (strain VS20) TaxID=1156394 RepID=T0SIR6_SAPDV|nr:hypothetical protein SDRG_00600 [Saprolegnia diclina VS20]EQC42882.1 hypothetical protein SDRG_00600 [Saprolegnia diclina VS20]|eukprot:XP_008604305.1 hypothetical protein SDRG_00600 [Saprolegnia diclina VS20]
MASKLSLAFLVHDFAPPSSCPQSPETSTMGLRSPRVSPLMAKTRSPPAPRSRPCKHAGCTKFAVTRGHCIAHGGGKRCSVADCPSGAKTNGLCWKHGGSKTCSFPNCSNRSKTYGVCWSHGGGKQCGEAGCTKTALRHGLCWAHGGGKRCRADGCQRPAYERNDNLCDVHCSKKKHRSAPY